MWTLFAASESKTALTNISSDAMKTFALSMGGFFTLILLYRIESKEKWPYSSDFLSKVLDYLRSVGILTKEECSYDIYIFDTAARQSFSFPHVFYCFVSR